MKHFLVWVLWMISAIVVIGLSKQWIMWKWIVAYWSVLALKNMIDFWEK